MNEQQLSDLLNFASEFSSIKEEEQKKLPFHLNLVDQLHINENAHSRILMHLLSYKNDNGKYVFLTSLIDLIKEMQSGDFGKITIESPQITQEKERIDLLVRDNDYAIIFENKIYNAADQDAQISRYINKTKEGLRNYREEDIYVVYLSQYPKEPELQSWGEYKDSFRSRYVNLSFCYDILPWLKDKILPNINDKELFLQTAIIQYIDYLEGLFKIRNIDKPMNKELNRIIEEHFELIGEKVETKAKNLYENIQHVKDILYQMDALSETYRQRIHEEMRKETEKKYPELNTNEQYPTSNGWLVTDVTFDKIDNKKAIVYMGMDTYYYCGFYFDYNLPEEERQVQKGRVVEELHILLPYSNSRQHQIYQSFDKEDFKAAFEFFCIIVNKVKSLSKQSYS